HNPFTGQKYDSDITFAEALSRVTRSLIVNELKPLGMPWEAEVAQPFVAPWSLTGQENYCSIADGAYRDAQFAFGALAARGVEPDSPEADKFLHEFLRYISAHEVGHTLGLRHNFRASAIHTLSQNADTALTTREGLAASVMDYLPANIALKDAKQGEYYQSVVGPYDIWAIEYAYKPISANTPEEELPELRKIASRAADPLLAFATDDDAGFGPMPFDMDPTVNRFDLGSDPLEFVRRRKGLSNEIIANMESKLLKPGDGYQPLRRAFNAAFGQAGQAMLYASKFVGGVAHYRDHYGDPSGRLPYQPVPAAKQKEALTLLRKEVFAADAFKFAPGMLNKLAVERYSDYFNPSLPPMSRYDVPIHQMALSLQSTILNRLLHPMTMTRILDTEVKVAQPFRLSELFQGLQDEVWSEAKTGRPVNSFRRALQREHIKRMT
ncbi:MAG: zinc-dependent metalloprotease, partial [Phycisphaerales bacterium]|nr:zinc-dependent metalloprotease [Phycisphaerales bacterium]